mgnify:CR=1 FL=1|tara:strand:+ start:562 stop:1434 length:873 start_codon:yes stop_codon:yes gene_type:complete
MTSIVVFGGSGFIGSHVSDKLSEAGHNVKIFDTKTSDWLREDQQMIIGDILDFDSIVDAVKSCDVVYNFAALSDINESIDHPIKTVDINIRGNINILEACRDQNIKHYIYASTVYVHSREGSFYRCSKQAAESYIEEYNRVFGLNYSILRFGSLYGPRSDKNNAIYNILSKAIKSGKVEYVGSEDALREYIHVEDAALASVKALDKDFLNTSVILTGQEPMKVTELLKMIAEILNINEQEVKLINKKQHGHYIRTPYSVGTDTGKKYTPSMHIDLGQGLMQMINQIKSSE